MLRCIAADVGVRHSGLHAFAEVAVRAMHRVQALTAGCCTSSASSSSSVLPGSNLHAVLFSG
jgi:hypothetical protein